jgi:selenocysteine lyase/cysteine desulfurase
MGGELDWKALEQALEGRVRLLAIGGASNALGTINEIARICRLARERGALTFVDAVHFAAHALVDVKAIGCDFLACSPYKFYGPHCGVLWGRGMLLEEVPVPKLVPAPDEAPERLETGTLSHEAIVGSAAAVDFLAALSPGTGDRRQALVRSFAALEERAQALFRHLWVGLRGLSGVTLFGPPPGRPRTPTLSFVLEGQTSEAVARHLASRGVFVSHGDFYAATVVERLKVEGLVRAGCACYTTEGEIDRLIAGVAEIAAR